MADQQVVTQTDGGVRVVTLQRPEKKNALTAAMYTALRQALLAADDDAAIGAIVIAGAGGVFTAGNDLNDFLAAPPGQMDEKNPAIDLLLQLVAQKKPLLAAVDGPAIGIGTTLLLHADYVVATPRARFALPFVNLGLCPEGGSSVLLPQRVGAARAAEWLLFGEPFDAAQALAAGLINQIVESSELESFVRGRAQALVARPRAAVLLTKQLLRQPQRTQVEQVIRREGEHFFRALHSPEAVEALRAQLGKKR